MAHDQTEFQERLARIAATSGPDMGLPLQTPARASTPPKSPATRLLMLVPCLAIVAVVLGWVVSTSGFAPSVGPSGEKVTFLERSVLDRMTADEIERMNNDPDLKGKSTMQKLLLSH